MLYLNTLICCVQSSRVRGKERARNNIDTWFRLKNGRKKWKILLSLPHLNRRKNNRRPHLLNFREPKRGEETMSFWRPDARKLFSQILTPLSVTKSCQRNTHRKGEICLISFSSLVEWGIEYSIIAFGGSKIHANFVSCISKGSKQSTPPETSKNLMAKKTTTPVTSPKVPQRNRRRRKKFEQFKEFASEH